MKNNLLIFILILYFLSLSPILSRSEVYLYDTISIDTANNLVNQEGYYYLDDTSSTGIASSKDTPITIWYEVEQLPFNFSGVYPVNVDYCNLTIKHFRNIYGTQFIAFQGFSRGELLNTTLEEYSYSFSSSPLNSTRLSFNLRNKDYLDVIMSCHYTDVNYLFIENILVGRFTTYIGSYECNGCEKYTLEELSNEIETQEQIIRNEISVYDRIQTIIDWNYQIWVILSWIIKIIFIFIGLTLIFSGVYYFYKLFMNIANEI